MKKRTYNNFLRALKIIEAKGYTGAEAEDITRKCFDNMEQSGNGMPLEWFLDKVIDRETWEQESRATA